VAARPPQFARRASRSGGGADAGVTTRDIAVAIEETLPAVEAAAGRVAV
jgi:hypothetical protein